MLVFSLVACFLIFYKSKFNKSFSSNYVSVYNTTCVKGIFILVVFFSHFDSYVDYTAPLDIFYHSLNIGQAMVTMFLFYSGYGVMESIKKSENYVIGIPKKRIFPLFLSFATVVLIYLVVGFLTGKKYAVTHILLSLIGWQSVGNSNWYIFDILVLYFITFAVFRLFRKVKNYYLLVAAVFSVTVIFIFLLKLSGKGSYWYDTVICYPLGMLYSLCRKNVEKTLFSKKFGYACALTLSVISTIVFLLAYMKTKIVIISIFSLVSFTALSVLLTMKIQTSNKFLYFLGGHLFEIYTLMRLPMIIFCPYLSQGSKKYLYFIISFLVTIILSHFFKKYNFHLKNLLLQKASKV